MHKFDFEVTRTDQAADLVRRFSTLIRPGDVVHGICRDPDDDRLLDCAVSGDADVIVTGDKDLLVLNPFTHPSKPGRAIRMIRAREFINIIGATRLNDR